jgi:hypothetical protein
MIFSVPNGGSRNVLEAVNLKREGLLAGCADLIVVLQNKIIFIEVKTPKLLNKPEGKQQPSQKQFEKSLKELGHPYHIVRSLDEFQALMLIYKINNTKEVVNG